MPPTHLPGYGTGTQRRFHLGHGGQGNSGSIGRYQRQGGDLFRRIPGIFLETADHIIDLAADEDLGNGPPAYRRFNQVGDIRNIDSVVGHPVAVHGNPQLWKWRFLVDDHIFGARNA